ncbi:hypothetical protein MUK42_07328 [Musa troglodytarum]|uniref:Mediator of RNA polymerase II transcription subunit 30 n=1 Tax=Musa troglodytarum TaxID=320322 RepID=A0A9E7HPC7_9LILI|nr:hypothetical protein MUK42_07328 [Musa troglodytarum]
MAAKSKQELGVDGQRHLEETINAAFQILSSMNDELCNPALWSTLSPGHPSAALGGAGDAPVDSSSHPSEAGGGSGGGALDEARLRYRSAVAALRSCIAAIPSATQEAGALDSRADAVEIERLEERASSLRKVFMWLYVQTLQKIYTAWGFDFNYCDSFASCTNLSIYVLFINHIACQHQCFSHLFIAIFPFAEFDGCYFIFHV